MSKIYLIKQHIRKLPFVKRILIKRDDQRMRAQMKRAGTDIESYGLEVMRAFVTAAEETGVSVFCTFGTLLGIVREGHFLKQDSDMDFGFIVKRKEEWRALELAFRKAGFTKSREFSYSGRVTEQTYESHSVSIDLFGYYKTNNSVISYAYRRDYDTVYPDRNSYTAYYHSAPSFDGVEMMDCDYGRVPVPEKPERYLESVYGEGWRVPSGWENGSGPNITFLPGFGYLTSRS